MKKLVQRLILLLTLACASDLHAHSLHQSTGEVEWNAETKKLEVSLTVFINDLELALIRHSEKLLSFEKTPVAELDRNLVAYLTQTFVVKDAQGRSAKIEWIGREADSETTPGDDPAVTLFFEVLLPEGPVGYSLQHAVLCELFEDQQNLLHLRIGIGKMAWSFGRHDLSRKLPTADDIKR